MNEAPIVYNPEDLAAYWAAFVYAVVVDFDGHPEWNSKMVSEWLIDNGMLYYTLQYGVYHFNDPKTAVIFKLRWG